MIYIVEQIALHLHRIQDPRFRLCCTGHFVNRSRIEAERWSVVVERLLFVWLPADDCIECSVADKPGVEIVTER